MTETLVAPDAVAETTPMVTLEQTMPERSTALSPIAETVRLVEPIQDDLIAGRPAEDRGFEVVETALGLAAGAAIGTAVAGPIGAVVGGAVGAAGGLLAGEALERHEGQVARTTDADPADADIPHI